MNAVRLTWQDIGEIARDLAAEYPDADPLTMSLAEVRKRVVRLARFADDPRAATDEILEAIQAAWYEAYEA